MIRVCPICGNPVLYTCYHEGDDVSSIEMPLERALHLAQEQVETCKDAFDCARGVLEDLQEQGGK